MSDSLLLSQIMEVLGEAEDGWWRGRMGTRTGLFPSNFVELIEEEATPTTVAPLESSHATAHITTDGAPQLPPDKPRESATHTSHPSHPHHHSSPLTTPPSHPHQVSVQGWDCLGSTQQM